MALSSEYGRSIGLFFILGGPTEPIAGRDPVYVAKKAVIRDNLFRNFDNRQHPQGYNRGIELWGGTNPQGTKHGLVQTNVIQVAGPYRFNFSNSGVMTFDNHSPDGVLVPATNGTLEAPEVVTQIQTALEEAILSSFL